MLSGTVLANGQTSAIKSPRKIKDVSPTYPRASLRRGDEGVVIVEYDVNESGTVTAVRVLRSSCLRLTDAAVAAVRQWRFEAVTVDGRRTPFTMTASVPFRLDPTQHRVREVDACRWTGTSTPLR